ncbi:MAG: response regulator [Candidatus Cloacimonetes bacterium]|nr:response regulator [Candidatus Cloacimonadota bacterium]
MKDNIHFLVIDDEPIIVERVKKYLQDFGFAFISTATNGSEAMDKIRTSQPEIVISDISMPVMSGLDLLEQCRKEGYDCEFIMLTGYNEFDYAVTALKNKAADYLLKPLSKEKLLSAINKAVVSVKEIQAEEERISSIEAMNDSAFLFNFLLGINLDSHASGKIKDLIKMEDPLRLLVIDGRCKPEDSNLILLPDGIFIGFLHSNYKFDYQNYTITEVCHNTSELRIQFNKARLKLLSRFFDDKYYNEPDFQKIDLLINAIENVVEHKKFSSLSSMLEENCKCIKCPLELEYFTSRMIMAFKEKLIDSGALNGWEFSPPIFMLEQFDGMQDLVKWLTDLTSVMFKIDENIGHYPLSDRVAHYIEGHYSESDLSLGMIAAAVCANPAYVSTRFREDTGETVIEHLNSFRLDKSADLLQATSMEIQEIANAVGFTNPLYFSRCFRKKYGVSPSAFSK